MTPGALGTLMVGVELGAEVLVGRGVAVLVGRMVAVWVDVGVGLGVGDSARVGERLSSGVVDGDGVAAASVSTSVSSGGIVSVTSAMGRGVMLGTGRGGPAGPRRGGGGGTAEVATARQVGQHEGSTDENQDHQTEEEIQPGAAAAWWCYRCLNRRWASQWGRTNRERRRRTGCGCNHTHLHRRREFRRVHECRHHCPGSR